MVKPACPFHISDLLISYYVQLGKMNTIQWAHEANITYSYHLVQNDRGPKLSQFLLETMNAFP